MLAALLCAFALSGCASLFQPPVAPGESEEQVLARLGAPTNVYQDGNARLFEYGAGAFGQYQYMARIGPDHRLISYQQVWTLENFHAIRVKQDTKQDVLLRVGRPTEITRYARIPFEAWNYGFKESGVWNSQMTVYFDDKGIAQKVENGPDPRFDDSRIPF
jgi:outer membrane protein assembly factor BamE (lipoprotein component of BamABCDE complex)